VTWDEWLDYGVRNRFCSEPVCGAHHRLPMTDTEVVDFEEGGDPCLPVVRLFGEPSEFDGV
jgi:hypothetical protein